LLTGLLIQFDWLAQRPNVQDWGDFLVIAILVIVWLASVLAKVVGSKRRPQQQEEATGEPRRPRETWQQRLARKAEEMQQAAEAQRRQMEQEARARAEAAESPAHPPAEPVPPPGGRITVRPGRRGDSVIIYERPTARGPSERDQQATHQRETRRAVANAGRRAKRPAAVAPRIDVGRTRAEPVAESVSGVMREPPRPLEPGNMQLQPSESAGFQPAAIIDTSDPDALMKAILHYEILGKPLALREPSEEGGF
jgi:hypothetical protein